MITPLLSEVTTISYDYVMLKDTMYCVDIHLYDAYDISLLTCLLLFTYCINSIVNNERLVPDRSVHVSVKIEQKKFHV
jgi:hypothetical protein